MRRLFLFAGMMLAFLPVQPATASDFDEVRGWLERMATAMRETDYQGTFVYVRGNDVETVRLTHVRQGGEVRERMVTVSGPPREVVRDSDGVRALIGEQNPSLQDPLLTGAVFPDFSVAALERARDRYLFEVGGLGRVAGHQGLKLSIIPRDEFRYGYELWVEEHSALLLRWVLYDGDRQPLAKLMFTELVSGEAVDADELESETPEQRFVAIQAPAPRLQSPPAPLGVKDAGKALPPGFRLAAHARSETSAGYEHLVFSDGLASVSVYLEPATGQGGVPAGLSRMGTTNVWSRTNTTRRVTAIGEVPPATLKKIGHVYLAAGEQP